MRFEDKIRGMFLGTAVGDSLGMPVETWSRKRILEQYPEGIRRYERPDGNKWFDGQEAGVPTDDTLLTIAVLRSLVEVGKPDIENIGKHHVEVLRDHGDGGYGRSTKEAIRRIANGVSATVSGKTSDPKLGVGNGVPMKLSPLVAWSYLTLEDDTSLDQHLLDLSKMTHWTKMSAEASVVHGYVLWGCLNFAPEEYEWDWQELAVPLRSLRNFPAYNELYDTDDRFTERLAQLAGMSDDWTFEQIAEDFKGTCYVYDSLPYVYAHWLKGGWSDDLEQLFNCINYGADRCDSDSNAAMLGSMMGALHGHKIFDPMIEGLRIYDELMELTDAFLKRFL